MPDPTPTGEESPATDPPRRAAAPPRTSLLRAFFRPSRGQLTIGVALFLTALIVVMTIRSQAAQPEFANVRQADLIQLLDNVTAETRRLEAEVADLERAKRELATGADRDQAAREEAQRRLQQAELIAGTVPAVGPGIRVQIGDPERRVTAEVLLDAIEELRDAGAEVIELNDTVRLVMNSSFSMNEAAQVTVDGQVLQAPYVIDAIGDPATLEAGARFRGGLVSVVEGDRVGGSVSIAQLPKVEIATVVTPQPNQFARPR